jgi:capsular polysaccharide biosynthesis protein
MDTLQESKASVEAEKISNQGSKIQRQNKISTVPPLTEKVPLRQYKDLVLSSVWIIIVFVIAGAGIAFLVSKNMIPAFQATTTIMVTKGNPGQALTYDAVMAGQNQARTYAQMVTSESVLEQVSQQLGNNIRPSRLKSAVSATPILDTQLIEISVEDADPEVAVKIADKLVLALSSQIKQSQLEMASEQDKTLNLQLQETNQKISELEDTIRKQSLQNYNKRIGTINAAIDSLKKQIAGIDEEMAPLQVKTRLTAAERSQLSDMQTRKEQTSGLLAQYQDELVSLTVRGPTYDSQDPESSQNFALLDQYQRAYLNLMENYSNLTLNRLQNSVSVVQVDRPVVPESPVRPNYKVNLLLGTIMGLFLAALFIFIWKWNAN